jgi:low affinity Fe/Cu permease
MKAFHRFATLVTNACGTPWAFVAMLLVIIFVDNAQVDHICTVVTTMMAFVIQHTQNVDTPAIQKKLDELIRAVENADDDLREIEKD